MVNMLKAQGMELVEGACVCCRRATNDERKLGKKYTWSDFTVHYFCLLFASGLSQNGRTDSEGIMGFLPEDIMKEVRRATRLKCSFCRLSGATIGCVMSRCRVAFHLPCGIENGILTQFMGEFKSFCKAHRPQQKVPHSMQNAVQSLCMICMNSVQARPTNTTLHAPCCKNSWFHRDCLQQHASSSGLHFFRCPLCNDKDSFQKEMLKFGIYIPDQDAAWEMEPNAFQDLLIRHDQCDVDCICPQGRRYDKTSSKWEVVLCDWCGSNGTHLMCSGLNTPMDDWICSDCYRICGDDKKVGKKSQQNLTNSSCQQAVNTSSKPTQRRKRKIKHLDSPHLATQRKSKHRSLLKGRESIVSRPDRRRPSKPNKSDNVVLGCRLKDWTPEERRLGCRVQVRLARLSSELVSKEMEKLSSQAALRTCHKQREITIEEAFVVNRRATESVIKLNSSRESAMGDHCEAADGKSESASSDSTSISQNKSTAGSSDVSEVIPIDDCSMIWPENVSVNSSTGMAMSYSSDVQPNTDGEVDVLSAACLPTMVDTFTEPITEPVGGRSAVINTRCAGESFIMQSVHVTLATSRVAACDCAARRMMTLLPTCKWRHDQGTTITEPSANKQWSADQRPHRPLSYFEFISRYFKTGRVKIAKRVMHFQDYLLKGQLPCTTRDIFLGN